MEVRQMRVCKIDILDRSQNGNGNGRIQTAPFIPLFLHQGDIDEITAYKPTNITRDPKSGLLKGDGYRTL